MAASERTQEATALRRRQAERQSFVPQWRDLRLLLWIAALWASAVLFLDSSVERVQRFTHEVLAAIAGSASITAVLAQGGELLLRVSVPPLLVIVAAAALPMLLRRPSGLRARMGLRNPFNDAFNEQTRVDHVWTFAKGLVLLLLILGVLGLLAPGLSSIPLHARLDRWPGALRAALESVLARSVIAMLVLAPLGLWIEHLMHRRALRMTIDEQRRERMREEVDPRVVLELRRRGHAPEDDLDAAVQGSTHALQAPGSLILLQLPLDDAAPPRLLARLSGPPMQKVKESLRARAIPMVSDLSLIARLTPITAGSAIPRAYYPALAQLVAMANRN